MEEKETTDNSFLCVICLKAFSSNRSPRLLPCQHYFCQICIGRLIKRKEFEKCPVCRKAIINPDIKETDFPIHSSLLYVLSTSSSQNQAQSSKFCSDCIEKKIAI